MRTMSEMPYHIGLTVKLYPSNQQKHIIAVNDSVRRAVYNHLVACGNEKYRLSKTAALVPEDRKRLQYLKTVTGTTQRIKNALPYLYTEDVDHQAIENAVCNYRKAWKNQKELHMGIPTFKKKSYEQSYQTNAHYYKNKTGSLTSNVRFEDIGHVLLPKLGLFRMSGSPKRIKAMLNRTADTRIGTVTIRRDAVGNTGLHSALLLRNRSMNHFRKPENSMGLI